MPNELYPIFLKVHEIDILIVGGGNVALEKISMLLKSSPHANITLVAPKIHQEIRVLAKKHPTVVLIKRAFFDEDLTDMQLVLIATEDAGLNQQIRDEAKSRNILANVADTPAHCDFYLGSIVTKGDLKIGISTNGKSPTAAKRLRAILEDVIPNEVDQFLQNLNSIRKKLEGDFGQKVKKLNQITADLVADQKEE